MTPLDIDNRRAIIDRRAIAERLAGLSTKRLDNAVSAILSEALADGRAEIARRLADEPGRGRSAAHATAFLHDQLVRLAYDFVTQRGPDAPLDDQLTIVGLGGTGRGEMAPFS